MAKGYSVSRRINAPAERVWSLLTDAARYRDWNKAVVSIDGDGMPLGLFNGERTYLLAERDGVTDFSMTEAFTGPMSGLMFRAIPDMTESFNVFADSLKRAAEAGPA
jgi:hypothetical protein